MVYFDLFNCFICIVKRQTIYFFRLVQEYPLATVKSLANQDRAENQLTALAFVYSEIDFQAFANVFERIKNNYGGLQEKGGNFYDCGSGCGKALFAAAMFHTFDMCVGIELLDHLYEASMELKNKWRVEILPFLDSEKASTQIDFRKADFMSADLSDATVVFANSIGYDSTMMDALANNARINNNIIEIEKMKAGSFFITVTKRLPSPLWIVLEHEKYKTSCGEVTFYIQQKN